MQRPLHSGSCPQRSAAELRRDPARSTPAGRHPKPGQPPPRLNHSNDHQIRVSSLPAPACGDEIPPSLRPWKQNTRRGKASRSELFPAAGCPPFWTTEETPPAKRPWRDPHRVSVAAPPYEPHQSAGPPASQTPDQTAFARNPAVTPCRPTSPFPDTWTHNPGIRQEIFPPHSAPLLCAAPLHSVSDFVNR